MVVGAQTMSDGDMIRVGSLFVVLGGVLLVFGRFLANQYRGMRRTSEFLSIFSAYVVPAIFVVVGLGVIIGGVIGSN
jgi:hypothetical protein